MEEKKKTEEEEKNFLSRKNNIKYYLLQGKNHPMYGKKHTEEAILKIKLARAKQVWSEETNKKRSETQKGRKFSEESLKKMSDHAKKRFADKKNHPNFNKKSSEETKQKMSDSLKGRSYVELHGEKKAEEIKLIIRKNRSKQVFPLKDTSIELKIQDFLTALKIEFVTHKYMNIKNSYQCDIFIPAKNMIIECDGDFFHMNPDKYSPEDKCFKMTAKERWQLDNSRTQELLQKGFKVLRLWECDIKPMTLPKFEETIQNA